MHVTWILCTQHTVMYVCNKPVLGNSKGQREYFSSLICQCVCDAELSSTRTRSRELYRRAQLSRHVITWCEQWILMREKEQEYSVIEKQVACKNKHNTPCACCCDKVDYSDKKKIVNSVICMSVKQFVHTVLLQVHMYTRIQCSVLFTLVDGNSCQCNSPSSLV